MATTIEQYGNLSEKELYEFLDEIKSGDEDIQDAEAEALKNLISEEEYAEELSNRELEAEYGNDAWRGSSLYFGPNSVRLYGPEGQRKAVKASIESRKRKSPQIKLKDKRIAIQREAFDQTLINLSDPLESDHIKQLISLLVFEHTKMIDKYRAFINKRLATLLNPFIPIPLKRCKEKYPTAIRVSPGFLYQASKEYGDGLTFWASPNIPYFFEQNTEQDILKAHKATFLIAVDKAVMLYHKHSVDRADKELKYASMLYLRNIKTYFDLLKLNPFWFNKLYKSLKAND